MSLAAMIRSSGYPVVIGMLHVPALPGAPEASMTLAAIRERVLRDTEALNAARVDALMIENFGDVPFYPGRAPAETVAYLTMLACAVRRACPDIPLGINVLRNDGISAIAVAHASGAGFVRINILSSARVADQGVIQSNAHEVLRVRKSLSADGIEIYADVDVKHSASLGNPRPIETEVEDLVHRSLTSGLVVSGAGTGKATAPEKIAAVKSAAGRHIPVLVGSGASEETLGLLAHHADGFIVGTSIKIDGIASAPVDPEKARRFVQVARQTARGV